MTPKQQTEYEQDMQQLRADFIQELARELAVVLMKEWFTLYRSTYTTRKAAAALLDKRLPGALEVQYPVLANEDQSRR